MKTTIELLDRARGTESDYALAKKLGITPQAISNARAKGRVSPELAAMLATITREPLAEWVAVAAAEQLPEPKRADLLRRLAAIFLVGVVGLVMLATPYSADASAERICIMSSLLAALLYGTQLVRAVVRPLTTRSRGRSAGTAPACPTTA